MMTVRQEQIDAALLQAQANIGQAEFSAQLQTLGLFGLDNLGSPLAEYYSEEELFALLGLKPPCP
jgi:hypothetical protein